LVVGAFAIFGIGVVVEVDGFPLAPEPYTGTQAESSGREGIKMATRYHKPGL
jgi:hypothetical protein